MKIRTNLKVRLIALLIAFICVSLAFSLLVIKDFSSPLSGLAGIGSRPLRNHDYVDMFEYVGFYLAKNLSFLPIPHLNMVNNQDFYPYGVNNVFQVWGIERDIFYAVLYSFFGIGPWLQFYYFLSVGITAVGTFVILAKDYGLYRAIGAGFIVSFFNFYAIHKYPHHLNISVLHWTNLSLIADFFIVKRVVLRQHVSLKLILLRACLLILSLGQELGYIVGFALMSFTVSMLFITVLNSYRYFRGKLKLPEVKKVVASYKSELFAYPRISVFLISLTIVTAYIYLPLVIQISREAKSFDFTLVKTAYFWTNPFRLLIPFFPIFNPGLDLEQVFRDSPEGLGAGSPGWFLLILGTLGLWQNRRQITIFVPLVIIFLLCLFYNPVVVSSPIKGWLLIIVGTIGLWQARKRIAIFIPLLLIFLLWFFYYKPVYFPTLKIFPWFTFNRVGGRSTVIYPVILCLFALQTNFNWLRSRSRQLLSALLVVIACTELYTAYSFKLDYRPESLDKNFFTYMDYVKKQPGEAVLDWPFCIVGGNGGNAGEALCPYRRFNSGVYALRRFHEKKVIGQYFGRLHPSQTEPYFQAGWDKLFLPDSLDNTKVTGQSRCFRPTEWSFFTDFYNFNDFAGINLYVDLLPEDCVREFYARFGNPTVETLVPGAGRVKFIPKPPDLKNQVNLALGSRLKFQPLLDLSESNLLQVSSPYGLTATGIGEIEKDEQSGNFRWGWLPKTALSFKLSEPHPLNLTFKFDNLIAGQDVAVEINRIAVETIFNIKAGQTIERQLNFEGVAGLNNIVFRYKKRVSVLDFFKNVITSQSIAGVNYKTIKNIYRDAKSKNVIEFRKLAISPQE